MQKHPSDSAVFLSRVGNAAQTDFRAPCRPDTSLALVHLWSFHSLEFLQVMRFPGFCFQLGVSPWARCCRIITKLINKASPFPSLLYCHLQEKQPKWVAKDRPVREIKKNAKLPNLKWSISRGAWLHPLWHPSTSHNVSISENRLMHTSCFRVCFHLFWWLFLNLNNRVPHHISAFPTGLKNNLLTKPERLKFAITVQKRSHTIRRDWIWFILFYLLLLFLEFYTCV